MRPLALDHVAFWVADRDAIVARCERFLAMHVIDRRESFTLVGRDARRGKLTFFDAEGPRDVGIFAHVAFRVNDLRTARMLLPDGVEGPFDLGEGVRVLLVEAETDLDYDLDHVALASPDPARAAAGYERLGFRGVGGGRLEVGGAYVELSAGTPVATHRPLLNHLAVLVESAQDHRREAETLGIEVESTVDAENTRAVFLLGPDRVRVEYVEHKPTFSLV